MAEVKKLCEDFWAWRMRDSPEFATYCGNHDYDDKLDDVTTEAYDRRQEYCHDFLARAALIDESGLCPSDRLNLQLLKEDLNTFLDGAKFRGYLFAASNLEGIQVDIENIISWMKFESVEDYKKYVARLEALPARISGTQSALQDAITVGFTYPACCVGSLEEQFKSLETDPEKSSLFKPFKNSKVAELDQNIMNELKAEAVKVIRDHVIPAYRNLGAYIKSEYMRSLRTDTGISSISNGSQFYKQCIRYHLSLDMEPQEIHDLGIKEVARIRARMEEVKNKVGFEGDMKSFIKHLREEKSFYYSTKEELLEGFRDICYNKIRPTLSKLFKNIPNAPLIIKPAPESMANAPIAFYLAGTADGSRPGVFYVNATKPEATPKYEMMTLSLHEGEPGHHLQGMYAMGVKDMPAFRQYIEDMKYYTAPTKFSLHTAYAEGWGLYCESLGEELGLYEDPYSLLGKYSFEIHRASRLVVDPGLHALGWSREKAVNFLLENTALSTIFINNEIDRYLTWPGQALAYKIGEIKIRELRTKAETELGAKFSPHDFHDEILRCGYVPMNILSDVIQEYINRTKEQ